MSKHDAEDMAQTAEARRTPTLAEQIGHAYDTQRRLEKLTQLADDAARQQAGASEEKFRAEEAVWKMLCEEIPIDVNRLQWDIGEMRGIIMAAITLAVTK